MKSCWPWSHDWSEWSNPEEWGRNIHYEDGTKLRTAGFLVQKRLCLKCKKVETRREYL